MGVGPDLVSRLVLRALSLDGDWIDEKGGTGGRGRWGDVGAGDRWEPGTGAVRDFALGAVGRLRTVPVKVTEGRVGERVVVSTRGAWACCRFMRNDLSRSGQASAERGLHVASLRG